MAGRFIVFPPSNGSNTPDQSSSYFRYNREKTENELIDTSSPGGGWRGALLTGGLLTEGRLTVWLAGCLAGWVGGWVACWVAGWLACWLAGWIAGWLDCWMTGGLAAWLPC